MRRALGLVVCLFLSGCFASAPGTTDVGTKDSDKLMGLAAQPRVIVALVDTGVNPYHEEFRDERYRAHPATYVTGFPADAKPLNLTLDAATYEAAVAADQAVWESVEPSVLYYIPGTRIVGAFATDDYGGGLRPSYPILDSDGHGTASASMAGGLTFGTANESLLVIVESSFAPGLTWASKQPWIDVISNSWQILANAPVPWSIPDDSKRAVDRGTSVYFAAGNGAAYGAAPVRDVSLHGTTGGPSWVVTIGSINPKADKPYGYHSIPVDAASWGGHCLAARAGTLNETTGFGGTSCSTPISAGVHAAALLQARRLLRDDHSGPRSNQVIAGGAAPTSEGPLADGALTRAELERVVLHTALPSRADLTDLRDAPWSHSGGPAYYLFEGYGVLNTTSRNLTIEVLEGKRPEPQRADVDAYMQRVDLARDAFWSAHERARRPL